MNSKAFFPAAGMLALALSTLAGCDAFLEENPRYVPWLIGQCAKELCGTHPQGGSCTSLDSNGDGTRERVFCDANQSCEGGFRIVEFTCTPPNPNPMPMPMPGTFYTEGQSCHDASVKGTDDMMNPMVCVPLDGSPIKYLSMPPLTPNLSNMNGEWIYVGDIRAKRVIAIRDVTPENPGAASIFVTEYIGTVQTDRTIETGKYYRANPAATKWTTNGKRFNPPYDVYDFRASSSSNGSTFAETPPAFPQCTGTKAGECVF